MNIKSVKVRCASTVSKSSSLLPVSFLVNKFNVDLVSDMLLSAAASCDFFAIDTEFSGLEGGDAYRSRHLETRYEAFRAMVGRFALLQIGLCFVRRTATGWKTAAFTLQVVCMQRYAVNPASMVFLAEHGLSLTDCYKRGIPFTPPQACGSPQSKLEILWSKIAALRKPLVMHNGLADLLFVWRSFFGPLPESCSQWIAMMSEHFPCIYDTKYLADSVACEEATYLQHLFRLAVARKTVKMEHVVIPDELQVHADRTVVATPTAICNQFARHGNCRKGITCPYSHDIDFIVHVQEAKRLNVEPTRQSRPNNWSQRNEKKPQMMHSAGFDAYATAVVFASLRERLGDAKVEAAMNHLYLMWHDRPLLFVPSQYE